MKRIQNIGYFSIVLLEDEAIGARLGYSRQYILVLTKNILNKIITI